MHISTEAPALNLFRFVGSARYWEDNVTRGLLAVITTSPAGGLVLRDILDRCADKAEGDAAEDFRKAVAKLRRVDVGFQVSFPTSNEEAMDLRFAVLVSLAPAMREEASTEKPTGEITGRFDAVLACRSDDCSFGVVMEAKLYAGIGSEQWNRYLHQLSKASGRPCVVAHVSWADVVEVLDSLPVAAKSDPIVRDYAEYLTDLYWLTGFRGFIMGDFTDDEDERDRRRTKLRQLASALVAKEEDETFRIIGYREIRGGCDIDLYVRDQLSLLGHTGLHSWGPDSLGLKLIIGQLNIQGDDKLWEDLKEGTKREDAAYRTYGGTQALIRLDKSAVKQRVAQTARELGGKLDASVIFRCWFHRFKDEWISSRTWSDFSGDDWNEVDAALRLGEPDDGTRVSGETLDSISKYVAEGDMPKLESVKADLEATTQTRQPSHHAILVISSDFDIMDFTAADRQAQLGRVHERHARLAALLRDLSEMAR